MKDNEFQPKKKQKQKSIKLTQFVRNTKHTETKYFYSKNLLFSVFKCSSVDQTYVVDYMNSHDDVSTAVDIATQECWLCYFFDLDFDTEFVDKYQVAPPAASECSNEVELLNSQVRERMRLAAN